MARVSEDARVCAHLRGNTKGTVLRLVHEGHESEQRGEHSDQRDGLDLRPSVGKAFERRVAPGRRVGNDLDVEVLEKGRLDLVEEGAGVVDPVGGEARGPAVIADRHGAVVVHAVRLEELLLVRRVRLPVRFARHAPPGAGHRTVNARFGVRVEAALRSSPGRVLASRLGRLSVARDCQALAVGEQSARGETMGRVAMSNEGGR